MSDERTTTPITDELLDELVSTERLIGRYRDEDARINDKDHYSAAVLQLEALAKAVLLAQSSGSLMVPKTDGARFQTNSGAQVMRALDRVVSYLGQNAATLMRHDGGALSKFKSDHTTSAVVMLSDLYRRIVDNIRYVAAGDLVVISSRSAADLVHVANAVARVASGKKAGADDGLCSVTFVDDRRCTKAAGHRPPGSDDPHTPN